MVFADSWTVCVYARSTNVCLLLNSNSQSKQQGNKWERKIEEEKRSIFKKSNDDFNRIAFRNRNQTKKKHQKNSNAIDAFISVHFRVDREFMLKSNNKNVKIEFHRNCSQLTGYPCVVRYCDILTIRKLNSFLTLMLFWLFLLNLFVNFNEIENKQRSSDSDMINMNKMNNLLRFVALSSVCICICFGKSYHQTKQKPVDEIGAKPIENPIQNEIIAKLNDTDAAAILADVMQKEPKFFDEFECKYTICHTSTTRLAVSSKSNSLTRFRNRNFDSRKQQEGKRNNENKSQPRSYHITFVQLITWNHGKVFSPWKKSFYLVRHKQILSILNNWHFGHSLQIILSLPLPRPPPSYWYDFQKKSNSGMICVCFS